MNILIVSHGIPSKVDPQWGCFELDQAKALDALGHKVTLAAVDGRYRQNRSHRGILFSKFGSIHAYVYYLFPFKILIFKNLRTRARSLMTKRLFKTVCKKEGIPDIIYAHFLFSISALDLVHVSYPNIPIVGIEHWSRLTESKLSTITISRGRMGYSLVDRLLAVSPSLRKTIQYYFEKDSEVVYDMVDGFFLNAPLAVNPSTNNRFFRFATCGSLIPRKGFDVLIAAFSRVREKHTELFIIGDGPEKETLKTLSKDLGVESRVSFLGQIPRDEIASVYSTCSSFVLASRAETFGVSYIEAMAMGLPAIATPCGGPEFFMNESCGVLVDIDSIDGLTAAMDRMVEHIDDYDPMAIREYVRSRFSGEVIAKQLESIFIEEINKKKA